MLWLLLWVWLNDMIWACFDGVCDDDDVFYASPYRRAYACGVFYFPLEASVPPYQSLVDGHALKVD